MKNLLLSFVALTGMISTVFAQKPIHDVNAEKRNISGFHAIEVSGGIDLYLSKGEEAVAVSASSTEIRGRIKTEVKNGVLKIWFEHNNGLRVNWGNKRMKAYVSFKDLDGLQASGGSDILVEGSIAVSKLHLSLSGGSDFKGKVDIADLKINSSGGSDVKISGTAKNLSVDASGGSDFHGYDLSAETCDLVASGGSDIYITVNKEMVANASGGSDIYYKGNGMIRSVKSGGGSEIKKVNG